MSPKRVDESGRITEPGEYVLADDRRAQGVTPPSSAMIRIEADGVVLDGRGHALVGKGVSDTTAVGTADRRLADVTIRNLGVREFEFGVHLRGVEGAAVRGLDASRNSYGLLLTDAVGVDVAGCTVTENMVGVGIESPSRGVSLVDSEVADNRLADVRRAEGCD